MRSQFVVPEGVVELRAFTHGLMPRTVPAMMQRFVDDWQQRGVDAWNAVPNHWRPGSGEAVGWWTLPAYLGDAFIAPLLGAPPGTCIMQPNAHWTVQALLSSPEPWVEGRTEVVLTGNEFPSVRHSVRQWARLRPLALREIAPDADGFVDQAAVLDAIGPRTAFVFLSHVGFTSGERLPGAFLRRVAATAHAHGALFVLDGYHANATFPIDVQALGVDVYLGGLLKEGCGSSGNGLAYVRRGLDLTPAVTGWFGDGAPFAFEAAPRPHPEMRRRLLGGTTAVASLYHAVEGVRVLLEAGLATVEADWREKSDRALALADAAGLAVRSPLDADRRSAMVILEVPHADRLCEWLKTRHVYTDSRQGRYLRLAPFVWNTQEEIDTAFAHLTDGLRTGAYCTYEAPATAGPVT